MQEREVSIFLKGLLSTSILERRSKGEGNQTDQILICSCQHKIKQRNGKAWQPSALCQTLAAGGGAAAEQRGEGERAPSPEESPPARRQGLKRDSNETGISSKESRPHIHSGSVKLYIIWKLCI
ncbi:Hypothetical predicted protein [Podarcis lilfordi]|uniref:Uncharacterized protein n=1 Tax=Podarcis lilfordi TaxID=74358 RepID=A0AA35KLU4_9SAUR|nr:Hypothetical predicted protein [Podarcis lilfordi]